MTLSYASHGGFVSISPLRNFASSEGGHVNVSTGSPPLAPTHRTYPYHRSDGDRIEPFGPT
jgi:hypothetical protein